MSATEHGLRPISEIKIGDKVWAYNEETGEKSLQEVVHLIQGEGTKELVDITLNNGEILTTTNEHPFYVGSEWVNAGDLLADNNLLSLSGENVGISSIKPYIEDQKVYNLTVNNDHTYYVGDNEVLSHNMGVCKLPTFDTTTRNHILRGHISPGGRITGYHHRFGGSDSGSLKLLEVTRRGRGAKGGNQGVYEGVVGYTDDAGRLHTKTSTFFPNNWTTQRVTREINTALVNATRQGKTDGKVRAKGASGLVIEMVIRGGALQTAYPVLR